MEFGEEQMFREDGGSTEFRWRRGGVREGQNWDKGITKGGNNKIEKGKGQSDISGKGQRGREEWDLTVLPSYGRVPMRPAAVGKTV